MIDEELRDSVSEVKSMITSRAMRVVEAFNDKISSSGLEGKLPITIETMFEGKRLKVDLEISNEILQERVEDAVLSVNKALASFSENNIDIVIRPTKAGLLHVHDVVLFCYSDQDEIQKTVDSVSGIMKGLPETIGVIESETTG